MLIPYSTDAPVYHWPYTTVGLIVANVMAFYAAHIGLAGSVEAWVLAYGKRLHPVQWVSSMFMHADLSHIVGNMIFLWVFGLIVEGKLGWWRFLACYLGIGIIQNLLQQVAMLDYGGPVIGSLGASTAIYGIMAMAAIWAPKNDVTCFLWLAGFVARIVYVPIYVFSLIYLGLDLYSILMASERAGTGLLHMSGFLIGLPLAVVLLRCHVVDCEDWDLFSLIRKAHAAPEVTPPIADRLAAKRAADEERDAAKRRAAREHIAFLVRAGDIASASTAYRTMRNVLGGVDVDRPQMIAIIKWLHKEKRQAESAPVLADLIACYPEQSVSARITLAQICVAELERPGKALDLLADVTTALLPPESAALVARIAARARFMQAEGTIEIDSDTW